MPEQAMGTEEGRPERRLNEPESLRLRSLTPSFTVGDLERSVRFYVDGLGFHVKDRWEEEGKLLGVMLVAGACHVGLSQDDWAKGRDREKGVGFRVWAETVQDLDALAARLREHGIEHDGPKTEPWGTRSLSVTDPDGFTLTFTPPQAG
ncbi:MAG TPA: VOC family protein [Thermoanaerobaculia bacterium]|nr:VOC family protein [Thermoanaerobaculia bacterium]